MWESRSDFQGRWEERETWVWFSALSTARHFHSTESRLSFTRTASLCAGRRTGFALPPASALLSRGRFQSEPWLSSRAMSGQLSSNDWLSEVSGTPPKVWHRGDTGVAVCPWHRLPLPLGRKGDGSLNSR